MELRVPAPLRGGVDGHVRASDDIGGGADALPADGTVVVVGASLAGWRAVETLRKEGFEGTISLVGDEQHLPYDRPPLSKQVLAGTWPPEKAVLADKRRSSELRVHEVLGRRAVRLDVEGRRVELHDGTLVDGDAIVIATGAKPRRLPRHRGIGSGDGLFTLRTLDDSLALRPAVTAVESRPCRRDRRRVHRRRRSPRPAPVWDAGSRCSRHSTSRLRNVHRSRAGRALRRRCTVPMVSSCGPKSPCRVSTGLERTATGAAGGLVVELAGGEALPADVVVVGIGVVPTTGWLAGSGLTLENGVVCDDRLFAADGIVAAGDIARWQWRHDGGEELVRIEHWQVAAEAGVAAARSLLAGRADAAPFAPVPYFWSDQYGVRLQVLGNPGGDDDVDRDRGLARGGQVRCALRPRRSPARRHGHRQAAAAHGLPGAARRRAPVGTMGWPTAAPDDPTAVPCAARIGA